MKFWISKFTCTISIKKKMYNMRHRFILISDFSCQAQKHVYDFCIFLQPETYYLVFHLCLLLRYYNCRCRPYYGQTHIQKRWSIVLDYYTYIGFLFITNHLIILQLNNYNFLGYILFMTLQQNIFKIVYLNVQSNYEGCYGLIFKYHWS